MATEAATKLATTILNAVEVSAAVGTAGGSYMQESNQSQIIQQGGTAIEFLASQIDAAAALLEETAGKGPPSKARLAMILAQKGLAVSDFHEKTQCGGALASVGISIALTVGSAPTGPGGWILAGASLLSDLYAAEVDCRKSVNKVGKKIDEAENAIARFIGRMEYEIIQKYGGGYP